MRHCLLLAVVYIILLSEKVCAAASFDHQPLSATGTRSSRNLRSYETTDLDKDTGNEERGFFNPKKLLDVFKNGQAVKDTSKVDELVSSWIKTIGLSDDGLKALLKNPQQNKLAIKAYKKRLAKVDSLTNSRKIKKAMRKPSDRDKLFGLWHTDEAVSNAIVTKLSKDFMKNKDVILAYNEYRTVLKYGERFDGWLKMTDLKKIKKEIDLKNDDVVEKMFANWYHVDGKRAADMDKAFAANPKLATEYRLVREEFQKYGSNQFLKQQLQPSIQKRNDELAELVKRATADRR